MIWEKMCRFITSHLEPLENLWKLMVEKGYNKLVIRNYNGILKMILKGQVETRVVYLYNHYQLYFTRITNLTTGDVRYSIQRARRVRFKEDLVEVLA